ncbi:signal peptide peptidase SppA [Effusibacillus consociatus]|uniref:Signal peptide peptidase SppA n=1 Tax=Effusibacillus consociatus TaxID=1117041 RepID=A0ABV9Q324_9BACL
MGRKGWAWTIIGSMFVLLILVLAVKGQGLSASGSPHKWEENLVEGSGRNKIVQLTVDGVIAQNAGFTSDFNSVDFISQLDQAMKDENVKAVVIRVNSPGGEVVASDEIHNKIMEMKKRGNPVIVSMGAVAASGGYYISAPADRIFANPATLTGSLGVIFSIPNYQKTADWLGYKENVIKSGQYKDIGNPLREMTEGERAVFQKLVDESYQQFVNIISNGRQIPKEQVLKIADGRVYSGQQAKELNLIDEFGSLEDATRYAIKKAGLEKAKVVKYEPKFSFGSILSGKQEAESLLTKLLQGAAPRISQEPRLLYLFQP